MSITLIRNDRTSTPRALAPADFYLAQEASEPAGGGLAEAAALWRGTAGEQRVLAAERCDYARAVEWLATAIRKYSGEASVVMVESIDNLSKPQLIERFAEARGDEYQEIIRELQKLASVPSQRRAPGRVSRLRTRFNEIAEIDFFENPLQKRVQEL